MQKTFNDRIKPFTQYIPFCIAFRPDMIILTELEIKSKARKTGCYQFWMSKNRDCQACSSNETVNGAAKAAESDIIQLSEIKTEAAPVTLVQNPASIQAEADEESLDIQYVDGGSFNGWTISTSLWFLSRIIINIVCSSMAIYSLTTTYWLLNKLLVMELNALIQDWMDTWSHIV